MSVAVVILNWNGKRFLEMFLPSLIRNSADHGDIFVADNGSTDDSLTYLHQNFQGITVIENKKNLGFAGGYNAALKMIKADYYILINSDIEVTPGWIKPVIDMMENDPTIGACQPKILSYHERNKFEYAGAAGGYIDKYGYPFCRGRIFQHLEEDHGQYNDPVEIFWATGACIFIRSSVYHQLGGMDADFFAHMEEIDLCWRMQNEGYRIMYNPESVVYHIGGGTLPKASWKKTYLNFRNNFFLLYKNLPEEMLFEVFAKRLILDGIAANKFLLTAGFKDFWAVLKAHFTFYSTLGKTRAKRKLLKQGPLKNVYGRNMVFEHFLRGRKKFSELDPGKFFR